MMSFSDQYLHKSTIQLLGLFLLLKLSLLLGIHFSTVGSTFNPYYYSDNATFLIQDINLLSANYGYGNYVKWVFGGEHGGTDVAKLSAPMISLLGHCLFVFAILGKFKEVSTGSKLLFVVILALHPYVALHDFKVQPNIINGFILAIFVFSIDRKNIGWTLFVSLAVILATIWRPSFGAMSFGFYFILMFYSKSLHYCLPTILSGLLAGYYSFEYSGRLLAAMQAYDNVQLAISVEYAQQIARNIFFSLFAREKYLTMGIEYFWAEPLIVKIVMIMVFVFHVLSIALYFFCMRFRPLLVALFFTTAPIALSWLTISSMRYLIPYIPILTLSWLFLERLFKNAIWGRVSDC
jgi:hypothetical protein